MSEKIAAEAPVRRDRRPDGPPAGVVGIVALLFAVCASVVASSAELRGEAATVRGFFTFAASVPLGILTATVYARLLKLGVRVPGPNIALFGGISASVFLATSGLLVWSLAQATAEVPTAVLRLGSTFASALGTVGFVGGLGLLVAGIGVPSLVVRLTPRWFAWVGLVLAAVSEISFFGLLWDGFDVLFPAVGFVDLAWLAVIGFLLPRSRHDVRRQLRDA